MRGLYPLTLIRGAGDLASGVAYRLIRAGIPVIMTELERPMAVRTTVSFSSCIPYQSVVIAGVRAYRVVWDDLDAIQDIILDGAIPVAIDPDGQIRRLLNFDVVVDGRVAKKKLDTRIDDAPLVIALGPGFVAGQDCHAVIETNRGHDLGRVIWRGSAEPDTGQPANINGKALERVLRAPHAGHVYPFGVIGMRIRAGAPLATVENTHEQTIIRAPFDGILRGLIDDESWVSAGTKIGDLDPRIRRHHCFTISDKSLAIGGGVVEAILSARVIREQLTANRKG